MKCPYCGAENPDNGVFCVQCEKWILAEVRMPAPAPVAAPVEPESVPAKKNRKVMVSTVAAICALALCAGLLLPGWISDDPTQPQLQGGTTLLTAPSTTQTPGTLPPIPSQADQWILREHESFAVDNGSNIAFIQDETYIATEFPMGDDTGQTSLDGRAMAILSKDDQLIYVRDGNYTLVAEHVTAYTLSAEGNAVLYATKRDLRLYHTNGSDLHVTPFSQGMQFVLSPDGSTVFFTAADAHDKKQTILFRFRAFVPNVAYLFSTDFDGYTLLAASSSNNFVYAYDNNTLYSFHNHGKEIVGAFDIQYGDTLPNISYVPQATSFFLSADHNQVLFYQKGKTYVSISGKAATQVKEGLLRFVTPQGTAQRAESTLVSTLPCLDMRNKLFCQDYVNSLINIYLLNEDLTPQHLLGMTQQVWLDPDGPIYFLTQQNKIMRAPSVNQINQMQPIMDALGDRIAVDTATDTVYLHENGELYTCVFQEDLFVYTTVTPWPEDTTGRKTLLIADHSTPCLLSANSLYWHDGSDIHSIQFTALRGFASGHTYLRNTFGNWYYMSDGTLIPIMEIIHTDIDMIA